MEIRTKSGVLHNIEVYYDGHAWIAVEENYDGPEDHFRLRAAGTREEAIDDLSDSLQEHDERWDIPNELDFSKDKFFHFKHAGYDIRMKSLSYISALDVVPIGSTLISISKFSD